MGEGGGGDGVCGWVGGAPRKGWGGRAAGRDGGWVVVGTGEEGEGAAGKLSGKLPAN